MPTFTRFPEFETKEYMRQNCTNGGICLEEHRRLTVKTSNTTTDLYQALEIVNRGILKINNTFLPVVDLSMVPGSETNVTNLEFTWKCVDFKSEYMDFELNFSYFHEVSIQEFKDSLKVNFIGKQYFAADDG